MDGAGLHTAYDRSLSFSTSEPNCQGSNEQAPVNLLVSESAAPYNLSERVGGADQCLIARAFDGTKNPSYLATKGGLCPVGLPCVIGRRCLGRSSWRVDEVQQPPRGLGDTDILT